MSQFGLTESDLQQIIAVLQNFPEIKTVRIFGSRAMDTQKTGSDIDLALWGEITYQTVTRLYGILNEEVPLPYRFDIVDYSTANQDIRDHIDLFGRLFYQR
jgi:predicted nucleotidyltransferase